MNWSWQKEYQAALRESNRLAAAQKIMIQRLQELAGADEEMPEVRALREALDSLYGVSPRKQFHPKELAEEEHHAPERRWMRIGGGVCVALMLAFATGWMLHKRAELNAVQKLRAVEAAQIHASPSRIVEPLGGPPEAASVDSVARHSANPLSSESARSAPGAATVPGKYANTSKPAKAGVDGRSDDILAGATPVTNPVQSPANDSSETAVPAEATDGTTQPEPTTGLSTEPQEEIQSGPSTAAHTQEHTQSAEPDTKDKQIDEKTQSTPAEVLAARQTSEIRQGEIRQDEIRQGEIRRGSVAIETGGYPSIRVPPELKKEAAQSGAILQIGEPVTRVAPPYPEEAERQGIEGAVKLHVVIAKDGAVQSLDIVSGSSLLATAAVNAVRQWRYRPTLLGDQPVEVAQEITVVFRITNTSAPAN